MRHPMMIAVLVTALAGQANGQPQNQARRSDPMAARLGRTVPDTPPSAWNDQDPADSLYRAAREALNRRSYTQAAYLFSEIYTRHPKSTYSPDAYYWEAYVRYLNGSSENLGKARELLTRQRRLFPDAKTSGEAQDLGTRINTRLARGGDARAAQEVVAMAEAAADSRPTSTSQSAGGRVSGTSRGVARSPGGRWGRSECSDDEDDEKMSALNALLQMDEDRALPILKKVMARRDEASICLRRKAVFLISQHSGDEAESMLLAAVRQDPDDEVRQQAVFWLGQSGGEHAATALDSILRSSSDPKVQEKAIFALSQQGSSKAMQSLRDFAMKKTASTELRQNAIFWIGQSEGTENVRWLKSIYQTVDDEELKDKIIFSVSQGDGREAKQWLVEVAANQGESIEIRKKALFWLGQSNGTSLPELFGLYDRFTDREMRDQLIFVYSQRNEKAAVDKLVSIAKTEKDRELRKKALFWLSQSKDPRVVEVLEDILSKP